MTLSAFCCLYRDAKAMYSCEAEHSHELSFPQGAHFSNGEQRQEKAHIKQYASADKLLFCRGTHNMSPSKGLLASVHLLCIGSTQQGVG